MSKMPEEHSEQPAPMVEDQSVSLNAENVPTVPTPTHEDADAAILSESRRHTRRSFIVAGVAAAAGAGFYKWLNVEPTEDMQPGVLRRAFQINAAVSREITGNDVLSPTYPLSRAEILRVNGLYGLKMQLVPESWRLQFVGGRIAPAHPRFAKDLTAWEYRYAEVKSDEDEGHDTKVDPMKEKQRVDSNNQPDASMNTAEKMAPASMTKKAQEDENHTGRKPRGMEEAGESDSTLAPNTPGLLLMMDDILRFPKHELVTQFKCIEGWSQIVHWAGIRLADFLEAYPPELIDGKEPKYVYMETPDGDYYNGYDLDVCRHPQTLLVTEMMGAPLTQFHGAPLRLHMPTKYGYKQIKRIGLISYTNDKPDDYWTKLGYDWYAGI